MSWQYVKCRHFRPKPLSEGLSSCTAGVPVVIGKKKSAE
jgi:hypothetical protein